MNNYICRWRDCITDPPPLQWVGLCKKPNGYFYCGSGANFYSGDQWLDVTTVPAVPREAVQAVADEMWAGIERIENNICNGADAASGTLAIRAYQDALDELRDKCGITPTEE